MRWTNLLARLEREATEGRQPGPLFSLARRNEGRPTSVEGLRCLQQVLITPSAADDLRSVTASFGARDVIQEVASAVRSRVVRVQGGRRNFAVTIPAALVPRLDELEGVMFRKPSHFHAFTVPASRDAVPSPEEVLSASDPEAAEEQARCMTTVRGGYALGLRALSGAKPERERLEVELRGGWLGFEIYAPGVLAGGSVYLRPVHRLSSGLRVEGMGQIPRAVRGWERVAGFRMSRVDMAVPLLPRGAPRGDAGVLPLELRHEHLVLLLGRLIPRWLSQHESRAELRALLGM